MTTNKAHYPFFWSLPLIALIVAIGWSKSVDIQCHDTYIVSVLLHIGIVVGLTVILFGVIYWLFRNVRLIAWMTSIHVSVTLLLLLSGLLIVLFLPDNFGPISCKLPSSAPYLQYVQVILGILVISQLLFLLNIVIGLIRHIFKK